MLRIFKCRINPLIFFVFIVFNFSCNSNRIYHEVYTFSNYEWSKDQKLSFYPEFKTEDTACSCQLVLNLRYIQGFQYKYLNLVIIIGRPDGSEAYKEVTVQIVTDDKKYIGDGIGDIWDLDYPITEPFNFDQKGKYTIQIVSMMQEDRIRFINEIGLSLTKEESDK